MKLFLSSTVISEEQKQDFFKLVGKDVNKIQFALIENAADPYPEEKRGYMYETRKSFQKLGLRVEYIDLNEFKNKPDALLEKLRNYDVVWAGGGNTYYLRWLMEVTGFGKAMEKLLDEGKVYGGGSAGALVATNTLKYFDNVDDPNDAPEKIYTGLGWFQHPIIPHWGYEEFHKALEETKHNYEKDGEKPIILRDDQVIIVNGKNAKVVPK